MIQWLSARLVANLHRELVVEHGGPHEIRDMGLLESATARPQNLHAYENVNDICQLAAAYGYGIARNHLFLDGNKRTALMAMYVFLRINGIEMTASQEEAVSAALELASGEMNESELAEWLRRNSEKL